MATVNFVYSIYRQIWQPGEAPEGSLVEFSKQFDAFCLILRDEAKARQIIVDLAKESIQQPNRLNWIWEEMQFEVFSHNIGCRKTAALSYFDGTEKPVTDYDLDLYNQRMSRIV